jgi:hypothetical protein
MIPAERSGLLPPALRRGRVLTCLLLALACCPAMVHARCSLSIDATEARVLADKVWRNESGGDSDKILWWNRGEAFASAGVGHFIWYPAGVDERFQESFPELLAFLSSRGVAMPAWLADGTARDCPWPTRAVFLEQRHEAKATELQHLLVDTIALQGAFMLARLESALEAIVVTVPARDSGFLESRFCALAATPKGRYALVDYVNFKGDGIKPGERYEGEGWGLKQVLEEMSGELPANEDFAAAAAKVLERRVRNAPSERREQRWLPGWLRRVDSYRRD